MNDLLQETNTIIEQYPVPLLSGLLLFTIVIILFLNRRSIKQKWLGYKTRRCLNRLGVMQAKNISCRDRLGDYFSIDLLVLRPDGISLVMRKPYPGIIFCADNIDEWTQMVDNKSYRFKNPLHDLNYQINALSACVPDVSVNGYLFFDSQAEFPKGHPESVIYLDMIPAELKHRKKRDVKPPVLAAWKKLLAGKKQGSPDR